MSKDWIARWIARTAQERAAVKAAAEKRYAHLVDAPRDWLADPTAKPSR